MPQPQKPATLDPRAERLLEWMGAQPWADRVVLGGGVALKHYLDFRPTKDCDAWWHPSATAVERRAMVGEVAGALGRQNPGCEIRRRDFGEVQSVEVVAGEQVTFSFQIAVRDVQLEPYLPSGWGGVLIESLADNLASKMSALVDRGSPRDFRDVRRAACDLGIPIQELWRLWRQKNSGRTPWDAKALIRASLEAIIRRRPLEDISNLDERREAGEVRRWFLTEFLTDEAGN